MLLRILHRWHRRLGIISVVFVIMLVITGLMLNHTGALSLDKSYVQAGWLLNYYKINPDEEPVGLQLDGHWISQVGERLYYDKQEIADSVSQLIGAVLYDGELIVAYDDELLLLTPDGRVIESLRGAQGVPAGMQAIGKTATGDIVVRAAHGDYHVDLIRTDWEEEDYIEASWSLIGPLPEHLRGTLLSEYRGKGLPWERVILDLHSGRLLGSWGIYLIDAAAIIFSLLAFSGVWMWFKRKGF